ncbi:ATP-binding protein, partial [Klebsiella pneumoniae]
MANDNTFPATLTSVSPLAAWLERQMASLSVSDDWRFALDLAACETATNIIRHALHEDPEGWFWVEFLVSVSDAALRFTVDGYKFPAEGL